MSFSKGMDYTVDKTIKVKLDLNQIDVKFKQKEMLAFIGEFFINFMRDKMLKYGDSLVVVGDDGIIKVHVHTNTPGDVLQEALAFGQLLTIKIENMKLQHENKVIQDAKESEVEEQAVSEEPKEFGFIATSMGEGLAKIFKDFGVDHIIEGGQTMNPSTEDFMNAIDKMNANNIIILPNNSNIIMAANQAKDLSDKNIIVIPTKNVSQAFAALVNFDADLTLEENEANMLDALSTVKNGQVTYAVRNTVINDVEVKEGNIIGLGEGKLLSAGDDIDEITTQLVESLVDEDSAIITLFYGEDIQEEQAEALRESLEEKFEDIDIELYYGGQPIYYYLVSVE